MMRINSIKIVNNLNCKSSYEYREKRGIYAKEKCDEQLSKSVVNNSSEGLVCLGLFLLAFDKIKTTSLDKLKLLEKIGYAMFMSGAIIQFLLMFKRSNLIYKNTKEYDKLHKEELT